MTVETPNWGRGKPGLFAITCDSSLVYIGKAQYGNAVFKEAKNRENKWIKAFKRRKILPDDASEESARKYIASHCRIYVAIIDDEQLRDSIGTAEDYLIFRLQQKLICNDLIKNLHGTSPPFLIANSGSLPPDMPEQI